MSNHSANKLSGRNFLFRKNSDRVDLIGYRFSKEVLMPEALSWSFVLKNCNITFAGVLNYVTLGMRNIGLNFSDLSVSAEALLVLKEEKKNEKDFLKKSS